MTPEQEKAIAAIRSGGLVDCTKENYLAIRAALQDFAGKSIDDGQDVYAQIALSEVRRVDNLFGDVGL